jgi:hypothetical protein
MFANDTVQVLTKDGKTIEGQTALSSITVAVSGSPRKIALSSVLSVHSGEPASPFETGRIESGFAAIQAYKNETSSNRVRFTASSNASFPAKPINSIARHP